MQAFAIQWPSDVEQVCNQPGPPPANDPMPVHLTEFDRGRAAATFDQMALSIAGYEASAEVIPLTSKFDAVMAGKARFTPQEQAGYALFRSKAQCNNCHRDGGPGEDPLFTDFTSSNIGTPANRMLPYYAEQQPDARGYAANPAGSEYVDPGVGGFLTESNLLSHPSAIDARWRPLTAENMGRFQVPTLRKTSISGPIRASSKHTDTMVTSRASSRSCTSTTRATYCGAAARLTPARAPLVGLRQSPRIT